MKDFLIPSAIRGVLTHDECMDLIVDAMPLLREDVRTSRVRHRKIAKFNTDTQVTAKLKRFLVQQIDGTLENVEDVEVVRYHRGAEYREHMDCFWRTHTLLVYLNQLYEGGEIQFAHNEVGAVRLPPGDALLWTNSVDGKPFMPNAHSVNKIKDGCKWVAVVWHWNSPYNSAVKSGERPPV